MKRFLLQLILVTFLGSAVVGCNGTTVVQDISQEQAQRVVTTLYDRGIVAISGKETGGRGLYNVKVSSGKYAEATKILVDSGVLAKPRESVSDLIGAAGIIPQSREIEALRVDRALAFEIEDLAAKFPGVQAVKAVVRQNTEKGLTERGASIVVTRKKGTLIDRAEMLRLISQTIPGIAEEKIKIEIIDDTLNLQPNIKQTMVPFLWFTYVPESDYKNLAVFFLGCVVVVGVASLLAGYWIGIYRERNLRANSAESIQGERWGTGL